jgi:hypothetical protein
VIRNVPESSLSVILSGGRRIIVAMRHAVVDRWLSWPVVDTAVPAVVVAGHWALYQRGQASALLESIPRESRPGFYGAAAIVVSLTGTLASLGVGQYLSGRGDRVSALKAAFPRVLARTWVDAFLGMGLAAGLFLFAYALDSRETAGTIGMWAFEVGALLAAMRFLRLAVLFGKIINLVVQDDVKPLEPNLDDINMGLFTKEPQHG